MVAEAAMFSLLALAGRQLRSSRASSLALKKVFRINIRGLIEPFPACHQMVLVFSPSSLRCTFLVKPGARLECTNRSIPLTPGFSYSISVLRAYSFLIAVSQALLNRSP